MTKKILILSSNSNDDLPNIDTEIRDLKAAIKRNKDFIVEIEPAVQAEDIQKHFHEYHPYIVHFCGHGAGKEGLVLDQGKLLSNNALSGLFKIFGEEIKCVLLNACTTETQAEAIGEYIPYVIGTSREILDRAAYLFAVGFYEALGYGDDIERCYELGCNAVEIGLNKVRVVPLEDSEIHRKFEVIEEEESANDTTANIILLKVNPAVNTLESLSRIHPEFQTTILEEVERKDYYDNLRNVLERFGKNTIEREKPISEFEYKQRKILVNKVEEFWIKGFLKPSGQILRPLDNIEVIPFNIDDSYDTLKQTDIAGQISDGKTLLILGDPGSGKTIALLQLAEKLIEQTQQDITKPIPLVFNLSSWGEKQQPIEEWLIEELKDKYQVPKTWSKAWIKEQQITLLLDGLDEVKANYRNACVRAINKFIANHLETEIVVCSRVKDYEALAERLLLSSAICIQPLSKQQLLNFLENADDSLLGLKTVIEQDKEIAEFAQTPLILNMMCWTYHGCSAEQCLLQFRIAKDRKYNLFESYIKKNLNSEDIEEKYPQAKVLLWLSWLAKIMVKESKIIFLIENLQASLLESKRDKLIYRIINFILGGLIVTLSYTLLLLAHGTLNPGESRFYSNFGQVLSDSLTIGLPFGIIGGIVSSFSMKIRLYEQMKWSWKTALSNIIREFLLGLICGLFLGLIVGLIGTLTVWLLWGEDIHYALTSGFNEAGLVIIISGVILGLLFSIHGGFSGTELLKQSTLPNQGVWNSNKNSMRISIINVFIWGIVSGLISLFNSDSEYSLLYSLFVGLFVGMTVGFILWLRSGGATVIKHFNLRQILFYKNQIPWNYAHFLDHASKLLLMKKVGGGYIFYHRMLMEHFANMELEE